MKKPPTKWRCDGMVLGCDDRSVRVRLDKDLRGVKVMRVAMVIPKAAVLVTMAGICFAFCIVESFLTSGRK